MIIFKKAAALRLHLSQAQRKEKRVGFVPTMGALHQGHISLLRRSLSEGNYTVCSIFVNPTQFNNPLDFQLYPVTLEKDLEQLMDAGCHCLFLPDVSEIYNEAYQKKTYPLGMLETVLEGEYRPGHFQGVCEVVDRLLEIVQPNVLYVGQKDYQQCLVIQKLLQLTGRTEVGLQIGTTLRENDGLAMSSRNMRLTEHDRSVAPSLHAALASVKQHLNGGSFSDLEQEAVNQLKAHGFLVDYVSIRNADTLQPAKSKEEPLIVLAAATLNDVRLIDNLPLN